MKQGPSEGVEFSREAQLPLKLPLVLLCFSPADQVALSQVGGGGGGGEAAYILI